MMTTLNAKGLACPMPVIMAKQEAAKGQAFAIQVDNTTAVENLKRLGASIGSTVSVEEADGIYTLTFTAPTQAAAASEGGKDTVFFFGKETVGGGDPELGASLMKMMLYTLTQSENPPAAILLMNGGVKLATVETECAEHLITLEKMGCDILVCGTCLNFYGLADQRKVGTVSNMYDILSRMQAAGQVISV